MAIEAVWDKLKKQKAKSDALPKRDPGGFVSQSLRKPGESFMDFTTRQHEQRYPGAQRMAREAGAGGWRAFTPAGAEYRRGIREEMPWLKPDQKYMSEDWKRMLANRQGAGMYGGTAGQVGGAPRPGPRPGVPLPQGAYQGDPRGRTPAAVGAANYNVLGAAPRPPTQVQVPMGSGYASLPQGQHRRLPFNPLTGQVGGGPFIPEGMKRMGVNQRGIPTGNVMYPGMERVGDISANWWDRVNRNNQLRMQRQASNIVNRLSPERRHQLGLLGGMETRGLQRPF